MGCCVPFAGANANLGAPDGCEKVTPLPVFRNGVACVSCWELSDAELEEVIRTRRVFVSVLSGSTQPPVFVGSERETRELNADYGVWKS